MAEITTMQLLIAMGTGAWLLIGFTCWFLIIKSMQGRWGMFDALMIGPCLVAGPLVLFV